MLNDIVSLVLALAQPLFDLCIANPLYILIIFIVLFLLIPMVRVVFTSSGHPFSRNQGGHSFTSINAPGFRTCIRTPTNLYLGVSTMRAQAGKWCFLRFASRLRCTNRRATGFTHSTTFSHQFADEKHNAGH